MICVYAQFGLRSSPFLENDSIRRVQGGRFAEGTNPLGSTAHPAKEMAEREGFEPFSASKLSRLMHADLVDG